MKTSLTASEMHVIAQSIYNSVIAPGLQMAMSGPNLSGANHAMGGFGPYRKGTLEMSRYVVLAGKTITAYNENTNASERHVIKKDMYFTHDDIIQLPNVSLGGLPRDEYIVRVSLNKGDWPYMDVSRSDIMRVELKPMAEITHSVGNIGQNQTANTQGPVNAPTQQPITFTSPATITMTFPNNMSPIEIKKKLQEPMNENNSIKDYLNRVKEMLSSKTIDDTDD